MKPPFVVSDFSVKVTTAIVQCMLTWAITVLASLDHKTSRCVSVSQ